MQSSWSDICGAHVQISVQSFSCNSRICLDIYAELMFRYLCGAHVQIYVLGLISRVNLIPSINICLQYFLGFYCTDIFLFSEIVKISMLVWEIVGLFEPPRCLFVKWFLQYWEILLWNVAAEYVASIWDDCLDLFISSYCDKSKFLFSTIIFSLQTPMHY